MLYMKPFYTLPYYKYIVNSPFMMSGETVLIEVSRMKEKSSPMLLCHDQNVLLELCGTWVITSKNVLAF